MVSQPVFNEQPAYSSKSIIRKTGWAEDAGLRRHRVHNRGSPGSGSCVFSSSLDDFLDLAAPDPIDLILTEFAINDGLELKGKHTRGPEAAMLHLPTNSPEHTPSRLCFEALVRTALISSPDLAIIPIELASMKSMFNGVAAHHDISAFYSLPVLSWRDAVIPEARSRQGPKFVGLSAKNATAALSTTVLDRGFNSPSVWVDAIHINLWGHSVVLDAFVHMVQQELRHGKEAVPELLPNDWRPYDATEWAGVGLKGGHRNNQASNGKVWNNTVAGPIERVMAEGVAFYRSTANSGSGLRSGTVCAG